MRKLSLFTVLVINSLYLFAQKELPAFGTIDKADLSMKECEFDKDAEAYKLLSYGDVRYVMTGEDFAIKTERRARVKILKDKGLEQANIKIQYYSKARFEDVSSITAYTYNLDDAGEIVKTKLEKSSIYNKALNNRVSEISFTMPNVKVGSVIEYRYTDTKKSIASLDDWYFQDDVPTRISMYRILVPSIFRFVNQAMAYQQLEQKSKTVPETMLYRNSVLRFNSTEKTYILRNVPALRTEPYMGAAKDYLQKVIFQLSQIDYGDGHVEDLRNTWPKLSKDLLEDEDFGGQIKRNIPHTKSLDDSLKLVNGDYNKMVLIHDYVRRNMNWNGKESIYSIDGIKSAWDKKTGSNGELNLILINLLRDAGLKAYPLLVSTKDNGMVNTLYPFLNQFNNTMTCVFIGDKRYVLNAADKYNPAYLVPYDVLDNEAFLVDDVKGGWITLTGEKNTWRNVVSYLGEITEDGLLKGNATVYSFDYCKNPRVKKWQEDKESFKDYFTGNYGGIKLENMEVMNADKDSVALQQKVNFSIPVNSSGEYSYFAVNLFQDLDKNPFLADRRLTDVDFNFPQDYTLTGKIFIPEGYEFDALPKNLMMIIPDSSIVLRRIFQPSDGSVDFRIKLDFKKSSYLATYYSELQEFYKKLITTLNEQVVIKKKKS
jgi:hypothetical protein